MNFAFQVTIFSFVTVKLFFNFAPSTNLPWGHVRSHRFFSEPFWRLLDTHIDKETLRQTKFYIDFRSGKVPLFIFYLTCSLPTLVNDEIYGFCTFFYFFFSYVKSIFGNKKGAWLQFSRFGIVTDMVWCKIKCRQADILFYLPRGWKATEHNASVLPIHYCSQLIKQQHWSFQV